MPSHAITPTAATTGGAFRTIHVVLWIGQALLAAVFLLVGYTHAIAVAIARAPWVASLPVPLVRFIGVTELAGALGVLLPAATRIQPTLTPLAAAGLSTVMALAIPFHMLRGETQEIAINVVLGALAAFVAWARARRAPFAPRG
jgi:hypothetical protein